MGQQQLLLLIAAVVIVGLATIVGIRAATENTTRANNDALVQDAVRIASDAQMWKRKPAPFGGQPEGAAKQDSSDYSNLDNFESLGYQSVNPASNPKCYQNLNGVFSIDGTAGLLTIVGYNRTEQNLVTILVDGVTDASIDRGTVKIGNATVADAPSACP